MSEPLSDLGTEPDPGPGTDRKRRRRRAGYGCLAVLIAAVVLAGGAFFAFNAGVDVIRDQFNPPEDYSGSGSGSVLVEVREGDAASDIAATLLAEDVVKSAESFTDAAAEDPDSLGIQVGFYPIQKQMSAESALDILLDPENLIQSTVTFPEGWSVEQIVAQLAKKTDFSRKQYEEVLRSPDSIGLPAYAQNNPEGYLFPATYQISPESKPRTVPSSMVARYMEAASKLDLAPKSESLGVTPQEVMTIASLIQAEARFDEDFAKVSRVIYNRLEQPMALQFDSTVHYAVGRDGGVGTSAEDRRVDSPYNTYRFPGLPPTPIAAPGEQAIEAALNPADGPWLYFVTTNPDTGETKFAEGYREHLTNKAEFERWCAQSDNC